MKSTKDIQDLIIEKGFDNIDWSSYGDIKVTKSPCENLAIFNYTPQCTYAKRWNWLEKSSRGMIIDVVTGEIVARPFDKFFNWGENGFKRKKGLVEAYEKMDGSLGIMYRDYRDSDTRFKISTRGSFTSEQALWATKYLNEHCKNLENIPEEFTLLFEIIYPQNRVVVDYGDRRDLVLIGIRCRVTGKDFFYDYYSQYAKRYGFSLPALYKDISTKEFLEKKDTLSYNEEGFVLRFKDGQRCKIKGKEYLALHKFLHGISNKEYVAQILSGNLENYLQQIPEEFRAEVEEMQERVLSEVKLQQEKIQHIFEVAPKGSRKEFALFVKERGVEYVAPCMAIYDGKDYMEIVKKRIATDYHNFFGEI